MVPEEFKKDVDELIDLNKKLLKESPDDALKFNLDYLGELKNEIKKEKGSKD